jgi:methylmalonyl-CoA mutase N-terminal domain/subunit
VQAALAAGLDFDAFGPRLSFFFACHSDLFEETAKFRAARRMWASIAKHTFGAGHERAMMLRFHTQTGGSTLTAQQPDNNVVRTAYQALAAVLGGTQSLHTNAKDEALGLPTEASASTALRTQQILAYETGVPRAIDPLAGSYYLEHLTDALERDAGELLRQIDDLGGSVAAIEAGFIQEEIEASAYRQQLEIESGARTMVGVNSFLSEDRESVPIQAIDPEVQARREAEVQAYRRRRNADDALAALAAVERAALGSDNLFPYVQNAFRRGATLGEICGRLRSLWGEFG